MYGFTYANLKAKRSPHEHKHNSNHGGSRADRRKRFGAVRGAGAAAGNLYVLEGSLEYQVESKPPVTLKAGDVLFIPAGTIHTAKNVGSRPGTELATYVVEKGKPLVVVVE